MLNVFNANIQVEKATNVYPDKVKITIPPNYVGVDSFLYVGYGVGPNGSIIDSDTTKIIVNSSFQFGFVLDSLFVGNLKVKTGNVGLLLENIQYYSTGYTFNRKSVIYQLINMFFSKTNNQIHAFSFPRMISSFPFNIYNTRPGPRIDTAYYSDELQVKWNKIWHITSYDISLFLQWVNSGMPSGYSIPSSILNWPAHGDTTKGEPWLVAPFVDVNANGIYEPAQGDYPKIKGKEALWFVYYFDERLKPDALPLEAQIMLYTMDRPNDSALQNTVFMHTRMINRSQNQYDSSYYSLYVDADLGNYQDDYLGSMPNRNTMYFYNGDTNDENNGAAIGFLDKLPALGVTLLKGAKQDNDGFDNNKGIGANETPYGTGFGDGIPDNEDWNMTYSAEYSFSGGCSVSLQDDDSSYYYLLQNKPLSSFSFI